MINQVLSIEQSMELQCLGLNSTYGSMYWHNYNTEEDPQYELCSYPDIGDITTFTLQDLLNTLPKPCYLNCIDADFYQCQVVTDNGSITTSGRTAITAVFNMTKLYLETYEI